MPIKWVFFMQQVFPANRQVFAGKFPSCFEDKQTRFTKVLQRINQKRTAYDLVKPFLQLL